VGDLPRRYGIILGSSLVAVAIAGEVTDCQTSVTREAGDLAHWSWRTIDGKQCWYRGARWKPKHELRWAEMTSSAAPSAVGQPETDNRTDGLDAGPTAPTSIDNAPEEWRTQFADLWPEDFKLTGNVRCSPGCPPRTTALANRFLAARVARDVALSESERRKQPHAFASHARTSLRTSVQVAKTGDCR
jgi:hypothetical protein